MNKEEIEKRIKEIETLWQEDIKKPHGGGLNSKINMELLQLRYDLKNVK